MGGKIKHKLYLLGYPVTHSLSPLIMNYIFDKANILAEYSTYEVRSIEFRKTVYNLKKKAYGFNLTMPYKEAIIKYIDHLSYDAKQIGAVNTVQVREGELLGYNTDWIGVIKPLDIMKGCDIDSPLVIGAGGAAKAAVFALSKITGKVYIANRTFERAIQLKNRFKELGLDVVPLPLDKLVINNLLDRIDLIINATPIGMNSQELPIPVDNITKSHVVFDMIYRPLKTRLIREAEAKGAKVIDGLWMLIFQAIEAVKIWFKIGCNPHDIRDFIIKKVINDGGIW